MRHYEYLFAPVMGPGGILEGVTGSTRDITDQKLAEEFIEEDRRRWQEIFAQTPAAMALLRESDHRITWVNPDYERLTGRPAEALINKPVVEALPEVATQVFIDLLDNVYRTGEPFRGKEAVAFLGPRPDNLREFRLNFVYLPMRDLEGKVNGIYVHVADVTEMVRAREQVEEREQQFRTLAESIPNLAWMAQPDGQVLWYNRRWYEYTGTTAELMAGWGWRLVHDPKVLPGVVERWQGSLDTGEPFQMVFPLKGADGGFRMFLTRAQPVRDSQGQIARWFGTSTDITEQQKTEEELRRINREMEEFAYVASHDLQEPLRMVNIYTQLLLRRFIGENPEAREYSDLVRKGVNRMEGLIRDLLTYSRTVQRDEFPAGTADLSLALAEALSMLKTRVDENGAVFRYGPLPMVRGDGQQLAHVFENLVSNALKYRKKDVPPEITISSRAEGEHWVVSVEDNGIGFEQQYAHRIFGLFKRLHKEEYPGTGLGLAICQRIVERYGGHMWAEGRPGEGSTFCFSLPASSALPGNET